MSIINNASKFKLLNDNPTFAREAKLQRFLRKLTNKQSIDNNTYYKIFPKGSQPADFMDSPSYINTANFTHLLL